MNKHYRLIIFALWLLLSYTTIFELYESSYSRLPLTDWSYTIAQTDGTKAKYFGNVTVIITSCARWDELEMSIESFEKHNTYPYINNRIVMDDCPHSQQFDEMHRKYNAKYGYHFYHTTTPLPSAKHTHKKYTKASFRCVASLYEALVKYTPKDTQWIFQSEDDWLFYRESFIEYSFEIYNHSTTIHTPLGSNKLLRFKDISFVSLKNTQKHKPRQDMREFCGGPMVPLTMLATMNRTGAIFRIPVNNNRLKEKEITYYIAQSNDCYAHYANSPGLKNIKLLGHNVEICFQKESVGSYERCIGCQFKNKGYGTASMHDNGFVGHLGHQRRHISISKVIGKANQTFAKVNLDDLNTMIPLNNGWYLNQSVCTYVQLNQSNGLH